MAEQPLYEIAEDIQSNWTNISPHAKPYLEAMLTLDNVRQNYYMDSGKSIVLYFLSNAGGWRGAEARRIKALLKEMVK